MATRHHFLVLVGEEEGTQQTHFYVMTIKIALLYFKLNCTFLYKVRLSIGKLIGVIKDLS